MTSVGVFFFSLQCFLSRDTFHTLTGRHCHTVARREEWKNNFISVPRTHCQTAHGTNDAGSARMLGTHFHTTVAGCKKKVPFSALDGWIPAITRRKNSNGSQHRNEMLPVFVASPSQEMGSFFFLLPYSPGSRQNPSPRLLFANINPSQESHRRCRPVDITPPASACRNAKW